VLRIAYCLSQSQFSSGFELELWSAGVFTSLTGVTSQISKVLFGRKQHCHTERGEIHFNEIQGLFWLMYTTELLLFQL